MNGWKEFLSHKPSVVCAALAATLIVLLGVVFFRFGFVTTQTMSRTYAGPDDRPVAFAGETFGRVLSTDVERKKLDRPLGPIDEVMLQSNGDPDRRLSQIFGHKFLGPVSNTVARAAAKEVAMDIQAQCGIALYRTEPGFRGLASWYGSTNGLCVQVGCYSNFFQGEPVLYLTVSSNIRRKPTSRPVVTELMGHRIGAPADGDGAPKKPLWKFERVVRQDSVGDHVTDGIYAVHSVSNLSLAAAIGELADARRTVESEFDIPLHRDADYDDYKEFSFESRSNSFCLMLEYGRKKVIRFCILADGDLALRIRGHVPGTSELQFFLCLCVVLLGMTALAWRRTDRSGYSSCWRHYAVIPDKRGLADAVPFGRANGLILVALACCWVLGGVLVGATACFAGGNGNQCGVLFVWYILTGIWVCASYLVALIPPDVAHWIGRRRIRKSGVAQEPESVVLAPCPAFFASPVFRGALGIAAFFCGAAICYVMQGGRVDDPIVGRYIPFLGLWLSFLFGVMFAMSAVALEKVKLPRGIVANANIVFALLLIAFLIHLEDAFVWCGYDMTIAACVGGFVSRLSRFVWLFVCACFVLGIFFSVLRCFPIVRRILSHHGLTASAYFKRLVALMSWVALLGFLIYELLILLAFVSRGWWAGA